MYKISKRWLPTGSCGLQFWAFGSCDGTIQEMNNVSFKACGPYVVTLLNRAPTFEWYIASLIVKYGHQKHES